METNYLYPGIVIDCSHLSAMDLNWRVVNLASIFGWDGGSQSIQMLEDDLAYFENGTYPIGYEDSDEFSIDYADAMHYACDEAVDWLNENKVAEGYCLYIDDNSLYLEENDNA